MNDFAAFFVEGFEAEGEVVEKEEEEGGKMEGNEEEADEVEELDCLDEFLVDNGVLCLTMCGFTTE